MLHTVCRRDFTVTRGQIEQMFALLKSSRGIGLAAPQVGIDARLFVTDWHQVFVNPVVVHCSEHTVWSSEGCLSLPGKFVRVRRREWITLRTGEHFYGLKAFVIQHEINHLDGRLITDEVH